MKVAIFINPSYRALHQQRAGKAFAEGLKRHGITAELHDNVTMARCDLAVFWSHRYKMHIEAQKANNADYLVMECGYIGERIWKWISLGFNGLNGSAQWVDEGVGADRWNRYFKDELKPWRYDGDYWLIASQVPRDESLQGIDIMEWCLRWQQKVRDFDPVRPAIIRWHPLQPRANGQPSAISHLQNAYAVITHSSNFGVDAVLNGVPVIAKGECSMVKELSSSKLSQLVRPSRDSWAHRIAYKQWTIDEIRNGVAWEHLRKRYR